MKVSELITITLLVLFFAFFRVDVSVQDKSAGQDGQG
jgi:hypothetical protein